MSPTRRTILRGGLGIAALATGAALTGCSGGGSSQGVGPSAPATIDADQVPVGGGAVLGKKAGFVVTQPTKGSYKAFSAVCPHAGCDVSKVADGQIICPCHGSRFKITDGSVVQGPATSGLGSAKVTVEGSTLKVSA
ncbi:Rieske (2Fe-2S) protein [Acidipropionibacterium jensenii]|uniref:Cytochrome bc1 complex Rieske iron-sulfur subunit n=1 Tax=Acidipropionibacterium jensenii TaxID=1749 RepID=A0A448NX78_9ACTN|nr:Rieske (2Fe-2S) protein [Acidipropionibacterium jensenii]AZZ39756.1 Rieske (2Fe-2S) protein [Acidipropionibacterium jensenii]MDN5976813.1 Rieske (2Fe-2S) protein [Acidipropionibacterium jensenii]MDN5997139.1 Rieske (2Fe-2S) protein [Acidipropionibacterium jensenii]MDN6020900.1 Rieske (2Fe-2S) protein [Acidipropionibacterium jensenii]MDN6427113.1 Rieske (2Fe-2S) protein [Acidipropionibacterium jensenii]